MYTKHEIKTYRQMMIDWCKQELGDAYKNVLRNMLFAEDEPQAGEWFDYAQTLEAALRWFVSSSRADFSTWYSENVDQPAELEQAVLF